ncbi:MAG: DEAD/DEAH box helicase, partial [Planctomycetaceae bacterium]|nr:DEAD/DEAH box helicase [Planctomycetaceae bacterium]
MDAFDLHRHVIADYSAYTKSFVRIADTRISKVVDDEIACGLLWPEPLLQLNPAFEPGRSVDELVQQGALHKDCVRIFRAKEHENDLGRPMRLHLHQDQAIQIASQDRPYVLTTGTGSGKSLAYIIPIVNHVLKRGTGRGIQAIVVYPMNALANSQQEELDKFLKRGFGGGDPLVSYQRYTGQEKQDARDAIQRNPPDIILTNYVMLEMILTRIDERAMVEKAHGLKFLVIDELHTYRGRQGADVSMLIRRCRDAFGSADMLCVGTSATMATEGTSDEQTDVVASVASKIFGQPIRKQDVIGETLRPNAIELDFKSPGVKQALRAIVTEEMTPPEDFEQLSKDPLAAWIESRFGIRIEEVTKHRRRQTPSPLTGSGSAAAALAHLTQTDEERAAKAIRTWLESGSHIRHPETNFPFFAFRLHQFITRGDTVWTSLESSEQRSLLLRGQLFVPGDRSKLLFPLVFCRSCGQEYYRVERKQAGFVERRENFNICKETGVESGYLYVSEEAPWPTDEQDLLNRVPEDWIEEHRKQRRVKRTMPVPEVIRITPDGTIGHQGIEAAFVRAPFRFCLNPNCCVAHNARQRSDAGKLATIGTDGRSTATSVLALSTILKLRADPALA